MLLNLPRILRISRTIILPAVAFISFFLTTSCKKESPVSLSSLLSEMTDRQNLTLYPSPYYTLKQSGSYDRKTISPDQPGWFANDDFTEFDAIETRGNLKEYVLFDADGPGAVVRWWMTFAGKGSYNGIVRIYIDNSDTPVIRDSILKVISGHLLAGEPLSTSVSPLSKPIQRGHNLYLPIPYSKHCKITYECDAINITASERTPSIYYNICYRTYDEGTNVVSFSKKELNRASNLIGKINGILSSPFASEPREVKKVSGSRKLMHGEELKIVPAGDNSAISSISLTLKADNYPQALRSTVLCITFDGLVTVWVPAGEFFGTGYMRSSSVTWNSMADTTGKMSSLWLMPFRESCSVELINYGRDYADAELTVETIPYKWESNSMYFGASWHEYHNIKAAGAETTGGTGRHCDLNFVDLSGEGVYAGDAITIFNTAEAWFGEGDEKIFVDGEEFPSSIGTGTEDYYGYAWCRPEVFSHPFIAQPSGKGNFNPGQTINMRYRSLDAIPFRQSISSNIELWHWVNTVINYSMTAYWYIKPDYLSNTFPSPRSVQNPVPVRRSDIIPEEEDQK
jgi:hypothetical protein